MATVRMLGLGWTRGNVIFHFYVRFSAWNNIRAQYRRYRTHFQAKVNVVSRLHVKGTDALHVLITK
jgi:hypothetical protein